MHVHTDTSCYPLRAFLFTTINFPGATQTVAVGLNDHGDIVGNYVDSSNGVKRKATPYFAAPIGLQFENIRKR